MRLIKKTQAGYQQVYDIEVANDHNFYANGVNVHNCTGLAVPTIAVATNGGVSVLRQDGTVLNLGSGLTHSRVVWLDSDRLWANGINSNWADWVASVKSEAIITTYFAAENGGKFPFRAGNGVDSNARVARGRRMVGVNSQGHVFQFVEKPSAVGGSIFSTISPSFNTGHLAGDIRRAYLCNTEVESVSGTELVTNGTFDVDTAGWTAVATTLSVVAGAVRMTTTTLAAGQGLYQLLTLVAGRLYSYRLSVIANSSSKGYSLNIGASPVIGIASVGLYSGTFVASANSITFALTSNSLAIAAEYLDLDNISVKEVIPDRSYKAAGAGIFGTLVKSPVAPGSQLVAYSGFSS